MGVLGSGENGVKNLGSREPGVKKTREQRKVFYRAGGRGDCKKLFYDLGSTQN